MNRLSVRGLSLMGLLLAGIMVLEFESAPSPRSATMSLAAPVTQPVSAAAPASMSDAQLSEVLGRPLFASDRRPDPLRQSAGEKAGPGLPHLTGILVSGFDKRAIFAGPDDGNPDARGTVVREGDQIGQYRVQSINVSAVALSGPDGLRMVQLWQAGKPSQPIAAPPLVVPPFTMVPPSLRDPARYNTPSGPFGMAMYRNSPAAPRAVLPAVPGSNR